MPVTYYNSSLKIDRGLSMSVKRRNILKTAALGTAAGALAGLNSPPVVAASPSDKSGVGDIKVAGYDYDRVRGIMDGKVGIPGREVSFHYEDIYSVNDLAFGPKKTYEVTEMGLIPYINKYINNGYSDYTLIPVFISRTFRHRNIFVRSDSGIKKPEDLKGKRVGTPGYGMSANTWIGGMLLDEYGVKADDMHWIETVKSSDAGKLGGSGWSAFNGVDMHSKYYYGKDFPIELGPDGVNESELLLSGGCDALITAITPQSFLDGDPGIKRLFPDVRKTEQAYYRKTGLFPIMHVIAVRRDAIDADPGLPKAVFEMYSQAKEIAYANMETTTSLKVTLPWVTQEFEDTRRLMGENYWAYGIEANRKELELVMRYVYEQGLVKSPLQFEELFHASTLQLTES
jgi:4,5-dihydroxyphthalate decarboxylase